MRVFVTGGAGFLGRAILRQVKRGDLDWEVTAYSRDETLQDLAKGKYPFARYILGDVRDLERLKLAMGGHDWVIHAAAEKYIPEAELNAADCIAVNVGGAENVMVAARDVGVQRVVGISTDKAVQPVNTYGMTKAVMERLFQEEQQYHQAPAFTLVRYGNVVGSTGSVIPIFRRQYEETGKVRVTNPNMTRFWMGVDEAIGFIRIALSEVNSGSIVIPSARAMTLVDVAKAATKDDVEIELIGERPGEKKHELLVHYEESVRVRRHEGFLELRPPGSPATGEAFTVASHTPKYFMEPSEMRELIKDAEEV